MSEKKVTKKTVGGQSLNVLAKKPRRFVCYHCGKKIKEGEKYVIVGTHVGIKEKETFSEYFYHLKCWGDYFNERVTDRLNVAQRQAMAVIKQSPMFNLVKGLLPPEQRDA